MRLGERIRERRNELGLTQGDLADRVGCSTGHISTIESGTRGVTAKLLRKIEEELDLKAGELLVLQHQVTEQDIDIEPAVPKVFVRNIPRIDNLGDLSKSLLTTEFLGGDRPVTVPGSMEGDLVACVVQDRASEPEIRQGDIAVFRRDAKPQGGDYVVVEVSGAISVRVYVKSGPARILMSVNPKYLPEHLPYDKMNSIGGVLVFLFRDYSSELTSSE